MTSSLSHTRKRTSNGAHLASKKQIKCTNFHTWKSGKTWVYSSAIVAAVAGAGVASTLSVSADTTLAPIGQQVQLSQLSAVSYASSSAPVAASSTAAVAVSAAPVATSTMPVTTSTAPASSTSSSTATQTTGSVVSVPASNIALSVVSSTAPVKTTVEAGLSLSNLAVTSNTTVVSSVLASSSAVSSLSSDMLTSIGSAFQSMAAYGSLAGSIMSNVTYQQYETALSAAGSNTSLASSLTASFVATSEGQALKSFAATSQGEGLQSFVSTSQGQALTSLAATPAASSLQSMITSLASFAGTVLKSATASYATTSEGSLLASLTALSDVQLAQSAIASAAAASDTSLASSLASSFAATSDGVLLTSVTNLIASSTASALSSFTSTAAGQSLTAAQSSAALAFSAASSAVVSSFVATSDGQAMVAALSSFGADSAFAAYNSAESAAVAASDTTLANSLASSFFATSEGSAFVSAMSSFEATSDYAAMSSALTSAKASELSTSRTLASTTLASAGFDLGGILGSVTGLAVSAIEGVFNGITFLIGTINSIASGVPLIGTPLASLVGATVGSELAALATLTGINGASFIGLDIPFDTAFTLWGIIPIVGWISGAVTGAFPSIISGIGAMLSGIFAGAAGAYYGGTLGLANPDGTLSNTVGGIAVGAAIGVAISNLLGGVLFITPAYYILSGIPSAALAIIGTVGTIEALLDPIDAIWTAAVGYLANLVVIGIMTPIGAIVGGLLGWAVGSIADMFGINLGIPTPLNLVKYFAALPGISDILTIVKTFTPPVGEIVTNKVTIGKGGTFTPSQGFVSAADKAGNPITTWTSSGKVTTSVPGTYYVQYAAIDPTDGSTITGYAEVDVTTTPATTAASMTLAPATTAKTVTIPQTAVAFG